MWALSNLTWPSAAASIQTSAETVAAQITTELNSAVALLDAIKADAAYSRHPLSSQAEALLTLRAELDGLLNNGLVITASPYMFEVGTKQSSGQYLNPQTAITTLGGKAAGHRGQKPTNG